MMRTLILVALLFACFSSTVLAKDKKDTHRFKIVGKTEVSLPFPSEGKRTVEYDPDSPDHLFITDYNKDGKISSKSQFLFTGKKFDLSADFVEYKEQNEIVANGFRHTYNEGEILQTMLYRMDTLKLKTMYYPGGQKKALVSCSNSVLNGEYKKWHSNGQLSFSGTYVNDKKNGDFTMYDESGAVLKKGRYNQGKLISGEPVIEDIVYDNPEVPAKFVKGKESMEELLTKKMAGALSGLFSANHPITINLLIDKAGKVQQFKEAPGLAVSQSIIVDYMPGESLECTPATVEGVPVQSMKRLSLKVTPEGVKIIERNPKTYTTADKMPEFPGGTLGLKRFIATSLRYPVEAQMAKIEGRVFVAYVVDEEGFVQDVKVIRGVDPLLNKEAVRVVKLLPRHIPGEQNGIPVRVSYTVPITFKSLGVVNSR